MSEQGLTREDYVQLLKEGIDDHVQSIYPEIMSDLFAHDAQQRAELEQTKLGRDAEALSYKKVISSNQTEFYKLEQQLAASQARCAQLEKALKTIADYAGENGCCPYGCDTPDIAKRVLTPTERP